MMDGCLLCAEGISHQHSESSLEMENAKLRLEIENIVTQWKAEKDAMVLQVGELRRDLAHWKDCHGTTADKLEESNRLNERQQIALLNISQVLGTGACKANKCEGCQFEMEEAAGIARENLSVKRKHEETNMEGSPGAL